MGRDRVGTMALSGGGMGRELSFTEHLGDGSCHTCTVSFILMTTLCDRAYLYSSI